VTGFETIVCAGIDGNQVLAIGANQSSAMSGRGVEVEHQFRGYPFRGKQIAQTPAAGIAPNANQRADLGAQTAGAHRYVESLATRFHQKAVGAQGFGRARQARNQPAVGHDQIGADKDIDTLIQDSS